ncbi:TPA: hypothetical protein DCZ15_02675 [Candidatus Falkowbacteria bacterium]|jgi:hypothetical protein|nr:MAG: hypothetical protein UV95_C0001G0072 [Candidatus Falkowbacteria bacterium GW2011_GWF2_43_32]HBA36760.1 hypothetical protein [Candidatus Falkowbacteria bacterium]
MFQQIIALAIIFFFVLRLLSQKKKNQLSTNEFALWLTFWLLAATAIIFIRQIDRLVAWLGFSGTGINFLIYLAVLVLFYLVFRLRLTFAKMDRHLTDIARQITLNDKK